MKDKVYEKIVKICGSDDVKTLKQFLTENNIDLKKYINGIDDSYEGNFITPLVAALDNRQYEIAKYLIENGANVNQTDRNFYGISSPLHVAISAQADYFNQGFTNKPEIDTIELLIKHSADLNKLDEDGKTPLDWAIMFSHMPAIKILRDHGAKTSKELEEENQKD